MSAGDVVIERVGPLDVPGTRGATDVVVWCTITGAAKVTAVAALNGSAMVELGNGGRLRGRLTVDGTEGTVGSVIVVPWEQDAHARVEVELVDGSGGGRTPAGVYRGPVVVTVTLE